MLYLISLPSGLETVNDLKKFIDEQLRVHPAEATITRRLVRALRKAGTPIVKVDDGEEITPARTERAILELVFNLDECYLLTEDGSWVRLVLGNPDPADFIVDYTLDLDPVLESLFAWIEARW